MSGISSAVLVGAMLVMVLLAGIPRRLWFVQLSAVLGWALVWVDGRISAHWPDVLGLVVTGASLSWWGLMWKRRHAKESGHRTAECDGD